MKQKDAKEEFNRSLREPSCPSGERLSARDTADVIDTAHHAGVQRIGLPAQRGAYDLGERGILARTSTQGEMMRQSARFALMAIVMVTPAFAAEGNYLYRAEMVQAAPGKFAELVDLYAKQTSLANQTGDAPPFLMRHSQGDRWDLLLIYPMGSYGEYYSTGRITKRKNAEAESTSRQIQQHIAWREDLFLYGPPLEALKSAFGSAGFYHIEMLHALPGRQSDLVKEREMESAYNQALGRPELFIFTRDAGAHFDVFSIDFYRDIKHYSESADIPTEKQQAAARAAGYTAPEQIGPFLRTIIADHHDTLAVSVTPSQKK